VLSFIDERLSSVVVVALQPWFHESEWLIAAGEGDGALAQRDRFYDDLR